MNPLVMIHKGPEVPCRHVAQVLQQNELYMRDLLLQQRATEMVMVDDIKVPVRCAHCGEPVRSQQLLACLLADALPHSPPVAHFAKAERHLGGPQMLELG